MATPVIQGYASANGGGTASSSISVTCPSGVASGDLLIYVCGNDNATTTAQFNNTTLKPSGFTLRKQVSTATADAAIGVFYKVANGTEGGTSISCSAATSNDMWAAILHITGYNTGSIFTTDGTTYDNASTSAATITGVSFSGSYGLSLAVGSFDGADGSPFSASAGWDLFIDEAAGTGGNAVSGFVASKSLPGASITITPSVTDGLVGFQIGINGDTTPPAYKITAVSGTYSATGVSALLKHTFSPLTATSGSYSYTGSNSTNFIRVVAPLSVVSGTYSYSGAIASLVPYRSINATAAEFSYTGLDATLSRVGVKGFEGTAFERTAFLNTLTATELIADYGIYTLSGVSASISRGLKVSASTGTFAVTGVAATTSAGRVAAASPAPYSINGITNQITASRRAAVSAGAYSVSGVAQTLAFGRHIIIGAGNYTYIGIDASSLFARVLTATSGVYDYTTFDITFGKTKLFSLSGSSYSLTPFTADFSYIRNFFAANGNYPISGVDLIFSAGRSVYPSPATYTITPSDFTFLEKGHPDLVALARPFTYAGAPARLYFSSFLYIDGELIRVPYEVKGLIVRPSLVFPDPVDIDVSDEVRNLFVEHLRYPNETSDIIIPLEDRFLGVEEEVRIMYVEPRLR